MAIYAFDGTGNEDHGEGSPDNTNVVRFLDYYQAEQDHLALTILSENEEYIAGVGTRFSVIGKIFGGFNGAGGRSRVKQFLSYFEENWLSGDHDVDIIGYSRGAALALHFCNALNDGVEINGKKVVPSIRFLGIWDTVPAFGLPGVFIDAFNSINIGWNLSVPGNVENAFHAMALDENRQAFQIHRPKVKGNDTHLTETWFKGVHSDVGGGNGTFGLSSISLYWMLENAAACGLPVDTAKAEEIKIDFAPGSSPYKNKFGGEQERRSPREGDIFHPTAAAPIALDTPLTLEVPSGNKFNVFDLLLEPNASYLILTDENEKWTDEWIDCDSSGWPEELPEDKPGPWDNIKWGILKSYIATHFKRVKEANWFELVFCEDYDLDTAKPVGKGQFADPSTPLTVSKSCRLCLFANDAESKYHNNYGSIHIKIKRIS